MKKIQVALASACFLFSQGLFAQDNMGFIPRASLGFSNYNFTQAPRAGLLGASPQGDFPEVEFDVTFLMLGVGGTFFINNFYLDLYLQQSSDEDDSFDFPAASFTETFEGDRQDYAITAGMKLLEGKMGLYAGYKVGQSKAAGTQGTRLKFKEDGFFIGANYSFPIAEAGVLTFNLAYAFLNGDLDETVTPGLATLFGTTPDVLAIDASSDANGLSYGATWSGAINQHLNYSLGVDANSYDFDKVKNNGVAAPPSKFEEDFVTVKFSLSYRF